jgi:hypothetical protein
MPVYHLKVHPTSTAAPASFPDLLQVLGPCVPVQLEVTPALALSLTGAGKPVPAPVSGLAVNPVGTTTLAGATGRAPSPMYPMRLVVPGNGMTLDYSGMVGANILSLGYVALLGRDVLRNAMLLYVGHVGEYSLST